ASIIPSINQLQDLSAIEEIVMIGYPIGLWDKNNNFPIFRKGYTAAHPAYDFNNKGIGLLDIAAFPGSSGSPVFILNENSYSDKKGNIFMNRNRIYFLGIQFSVPIYNAKGDITVENIPTQQILKSETPLMTNLAYYIKFEALKEFRDNIEKII
ncbi:MAG: serine protease, partial [Ruminococcus sp.]|nr:serine protease [Ruminococcus sp.]